MPILFSPSLFLSNRQRVDVTIVSGEREEERREREHDGAEKLQRREAREDGDDGDDARNGADDGSDEQIELLLQVYSSRWRSRGEKGEGRSLCVRRASEGDAGTSSLID